MRLDAEQRRALQQLRDLLVDGPFAAGHTFDTSRVPPQATATFEALGLAGEYRLVSHLGLLLFVEQLTPSTRLYYGNDSLELSKLLSPVEGRVLDLCAGAGAQALVCAQTARSVTAVEAEPLAEKVFWINAELNELSDKVEFLVGDLFEPVAERQFDLICSNPPFMPVARGVRYPLYADGGPDGLAVVRRVLMGLPEFMAPNGRCQVVGAILGDGEGPDLSSFEKLAADAHLGITISCPSSEALDEAMLASYAATALGCDGGGDVKEAFRAHFANLGATRLYYFFLSAKHATRPSVYYSDGEVQRAMIGAVGSDAW